MRHELDERVNAAAPDFSKSDEPPFGEKAMSSQKNHESVITFDDLSGAGEPMGPLPHLYAGFAWSQSAWFLTTEQMPSLRTAQQAVLFNAQGKDLFFESERPFGLGSMLLSALWDDRCEVLIEGWAKGIRGYAAPISLNKNVSARHHLAFSDVDRVGLITRGGNVAVHAITVLL